jgi:hypothetical protein
VTRLAPENGRSSRREHGERRQGCVCGGQGTEEGGREILSARWRQKVPPKRRLTFNDLHCAIFLKIEPFITIAVETSNINGTTNGFKISFLSLLLYSLSHLPVLINAVHISGWFVTHSVGRRDGGSSPPERFNMHNKIQKTQMYPITAAVFEFAVPGPGTLNLRTLKVAKLIFYLFLNLKY